MLKAKLLLAILFLLPSAVFANKYGLPEQSAVIDAASSGDNTIVSAVTDKRICVLGFVLVGSGAVTVRFESGAGGTALTGQMTVGSGTGMAPPRGEDCLFATASGSLLNLELSGAVSVDGYLNYVVIE